MSWRPVWITQWDSGWPGFQTETLSQQINKQTNGSKRKKRNQPTKTITSTLPNYRLASSFVHVLGQKYSCLSNPGAVDGSNVAFRIKRKLLAQLWAPEVNAPPKSGPEAQGPACFLAAQSFLCVWNLSGIVLCRQDVTLGYLGPDTLTQARWWEHLVDSMLSVWDTKNLNQKPEGR